MLQHALGPATLAGIEDYTGFVAVVAGAAVALVWVVAATVDSVLKSKHREESRREIAAYVAEGSISSAEAAALLSAGNDEVRKMIADGVAWGTIKPKDAERLMGAATSETAQPGINAKREQARA